jgi:hypothetical protein
MRPRAPFDVDGVEPKRRAQSNSFGKRYAYPRAEPVFPSDRCAEDRRGQETLPPSFLDLHGDGTGPETVHAEEKPLTRFDSPTAAGTRRPPFDNEKLSRVTQTDGAFSRRLE